MEKKLWTLYENSDKIMSRYFTDSEALQANQKVATIFVNVRWRKKYARTRSN